MGQKKSPGTAAPGLIEISSTQCHFTPAPATATSAANADTVRTKPVILAFIRPPPSTVQVVSGTPHVQTKSGNAASRLSD